MTLFKNQNKTMKTIQEKKEEIKKEIMILAKCLSESPEEDIIHDFGSMDKFFDIIEDEIEGLSRLTGLTDREQELFEKVVMESSQIKETIL